MNKNELIRRYKAGERDFTGADLRGAYLNNLQSIDINLSSANLEEADLGSPSRLINTNLSGANLERANLQGNFLIKANLSSANLRNCKLYCADLTGAKLIGADLTGADLNYAKLIGADLTDANLTEIKTEKTIFCNTVMPDGSIQNDPIRVLDAQELLRRYAAGDRKFDGIVLYSADLSGSNLRDIDMSNSRLIYCNLRSANLEKSCLSRITLTGSDLRKANLLRANLNDAHLIYTDLREANLIEVHIAYTDLTEANLQGSQWNPSSQRGMWLWNTTWHDGKFIPDPINSDFWSPTSVSLDIF